MRTLILLQINVMEIWLKDFFMNGVNSLYFELYILLYISTTTCMIGYPTQNHQNPIKYPTTYFENVFQSTFSSVYLQSLGSGNAKQENGLENLDSVKFY